MSTIASTTAQPEIQSALGGLARWLGACANSIAAYWVRREAIKTLRQLDDRALRDIGITRCHIEAAVFCGRPNPEIGRLR
jgi:uncharacterized protein YjiS (DUF1127 family)